MCNFLRPNELNLVNLSTKVLRLWRFCDLNLPRSSKCVLIDLWMTSATTIIHDCLSDCNRLQSIELSFLFKNILETPNTLCITLIPSLSITETYRFWYFMSTSLIHVKTIKNSLKVFIRKEWASFMSSLTSWDADNCKLCYIESCC